MEICDNKCKHHIYIYNNAYYGLMNINPYCGIFNKKLWYLSEDIFPEVLQEEYICMGRCKYYKG